VSPAAARSVIVPCAAAGTAISARPGTPVRTAPRPRVTTASWTARVSTCASLAPASRTLAVTRTLANRRPPRETGRADSRIHGGRGNAPGQARGTRGMPLIVVPSWLSTAVPVTEDGTVSTPVNASWIVM
jgi:hypothetical protein